MKIRKAKYSDIDIITYIIRSSFQTVADRFNLTAENCPKHPSNCTTEWVKTGLDRGINYYVMEIGNRVIGCIALEKVNLEVCFLERLAVLKEYRNMRFGKSLVDYAMAEAKLMGGKRISIGIISEHNELKQWYCQIGFIEESIKQFEHLPFKVNFMSYTF
jgi:N-acetylglutamate synthase-like GNAT family acetyltransferase